VRSGPISSPDPYITAIAFLVTRLMCSWTTLLGLLLVVCQGLLSSQACLRGLGMFRLGCPLSEKGSSGVSGSWIALVPC
jgi:hypothetical protein